MNADNQISFASPEDPGKKPSQRILYETLVVMGLTVVPSLLWPSVKGILVFLPIAYLLIERHLRKRSWKVLGFDSKGVGQAFRANWYLVLLAIAIQAATALIALLFWPEFLEHLETRIALLTDGTTPGVVFFMLLVPAVLGEEMAYRGLFQERIGWSIGQPTAIALVSVLFGLMHWAPGNPLIVITDMALIAVDGALYGIIFSRGKNIYIAWLAHFVANMAAFACLLLL